MIDESEFQRRLEAEAHSCHRWFNGPGTTFPSHSHPYRKILYCLRGSIRFELTAGGSSISLGPGDRLDLPAGTPHSALVGSAGVTCIEGREG